MDAQDYSSLSLMGDSPALGGDVCSKVPFLINYRNKQWSDYGYLCKYLSFIYSTKEILLWMFLYVCLLAGFLKIYDQIQWIVVIIIIIRISYSVPCGWKVGWNFVVQKTFKELHGKTPLQDPLKQLNYMGTCFEKENRNKT